MGVGVSALMVAHQDQSRGGFVTGERRRLLARRSSSGGAIGGCSTVPLSRGGSCAGDKSIGAGSTHSAKEEREFIEESAIERAVSNGGGWRRESSVGTVRGEYAQMRD